MTIRPEGSECLHPVTKSCPVAACPYHSQNFVECVDCDARYCPRCGPPSNVEIERLDHSCLNFEGSGQFLLDWFPICKNCGWTENSHHQWERHDRFVTSLGPRWQCKICGRTAYDMYGACTPETPPADYPPCGTWYSNS